jgi:hypothetical protein
MRRCDVSDLLVEECADCRHNTHGSRGRSNLDNAGSDWPLPGAKVMDAITAIFTGDCSADCGAPIKRGEMIVKLDIDGVGKWRHVECS